MYLIRVLALPFCLSLPATLGAQTAVIRMPGKTVEVVGLKRWTVSMIQDSMAKYSPGDSLHSHACAAVLRYKLGFADAAATSYRGIGDGEHVVVSVVEPQDSVRARFRPAPFDSAGTRREWSDALAVHARNRRAFHAAIHLYLPRQKSPREPLPAELRADSADLAQVWRFLESHRSARDYEVARHTLLGDPNFGNRMLAAALLANFPDRDPAWWALVEAMREEDGIVKGVAASILAGLAEHSPRRVDWEPVSPAIHAMLNGTSLFMLPTLLRVLPATGAGPHSAAPFLAGGGEMLLAYVGAEQPYVREEARRFLAALSGVDHAYDANRWRRWIETLE